MKLVLLMWSKARWSRNPSGSCYAAWPGATLPNLIVKSARPAARAVVASQPPGPSACSKATSHASTNKRHDRLDSDYLHSVDDSAIDICVWLIGLRDGQVPAPRCAPGSQRCR